MIKIYNAKDTMEAQYLCDLLADAGVDSYFQETGSGEYLKIATGINIYGTDIFINEVDESKAKEIISAYVKEAKENAKEPANKLPWYKNKTILARILLAYAILSAIIVIIVSM